MNLTLYNSRPLKVQIYSPRITQYVFLAAVYTSTKAISHLLVNNA